MKKKRVLSNLCVAMRNHLFYYKNDAKLKNVSEKRYFLSFFFVLAFPAPLFCAVHALFLRRFAVFCGALVESTASFGLAALVNDVGGLHLLFVHQ